MKSSLLKILLYRQCAYEFRFWNQTTWIQIMFLSFSSYVTSKKLFHLLKTQILICKLSNKYL